MANLIAWLLVLIFCGGFWGVVIYFSADILFGISLPAFKAFGLGAMFFVFLLGLRALLKVLFEE